MCKKVAKVCRLGYKSGRKGSKMCKVKMMLEWCNLNRMHATELEQENEGNCKETINYWEGQNCYFRRREALEIEASQPINRRSKEEEGGHLETSSIPLP